MDPTIDDMKLLAAQNHSVPQPESHCPDTALPSGIHVQLE